MLHQNLKGAGLRPMAMIFDLIPIGHDSDVIIAHCQKNSTIWHIIAQFTHIYTFIVGDTTSEGLCFAWLLMPLKLSLVCRYAHIKAPQLHSLYDHVYIYTDGLWNWLTKKQSFVIFFPDGFAYELGKVNEIFNCTGPIQEKKMASLSLDCLIGAQSKIVARQNVEVRSCRVDWRQNNPRGIWEDHDHGLCLSALFRCLSVSARNFGCHEQKLVKRSSVHPSYCFM